MFNGVAIARGRHDLNAALFSFYARNDDAKRLAIVFPIPSEIAQGVKPFGMSKAPGSLHITTMGSWPDQNDKMTRYAYD